MLRVLGVDPGLTRCGVGVVEVAPNRRARLVHVTVVRTPADMALEQRLLRIADGIAAEIDEHRPDAVAVERVFAQANVRTVMGTAQAAGLALHARRRAGCPSDCTRRPRSRPPSPATATPTSGRCRP